MLFSFTGRHFIQDSTTHWHDSNPSHGRPPRRNRPVFENTVQNSKKIKKMGDLRVTSSNVAYQLAKILNLQYRRFLELFGMILAMIPTKFKKNLIFSASKPLKTGEN